ncbi:hypothetical protein ACWGHD_19005 [Streptomyces xanthophaeus]
MIPRPLVLGVSFVIALVLLLSFTLTACDDQPPASSGVEVDFDAPKKSKAKTPKAPRKPSTTKGRR